MVNTMAKKPTPLLTKNGRPRYKSYSPAQLAEALDKTSRPRDKDKIQRMLNNIAAKA
jgi:hypothetical protein